MSSSNLLGALALVAVLMFIGLIGLQVSEMLHYRAAPSVLSP
jgi:hypothetical protein